MGMVYNDTLDYVNELVKGKDSNDMQVDIVGVDQFILWVGDCHTVSEGLSIKANIGGIIIQRVDEFCCPLHAKRFNNDMDTIKFHIDKFMSDRLKP